MPGQEDRPCYKFTAYNLYISHHDVLNIESTSQSTFLLQSPNIFEENTLAVGQIFMA